MAAPQKRGRPESTSDDGPQPSEPATAVGARNGGDEGDAATMSFFKPPALRSAAITAANTLNKAVFKQTFDIPVARINDMRNISKYRDAFIRSKELLKIDRKPAVVDDPDWIPAAGANEGARPAKQPPRKKCLLLQPTVSLDSPTTWSDVIKGGIEKGDLTLVPYKMTLDYDYWNPRDILESVLPEDFHDDIPGSFNTAGHVAHLNLRSRFQPYKYIVGQVLLDKNPNLRTVINKIDGVGSESVFRTFRYEVLAGTDDLVVEVRENFCTYQFDYSKVYWNSKLEPEHTRILNLFRPGQVVCDVMAGIGPFAVPAGKRGVFVWANDMNPESYSALRDAIERNKVGAFVRPLNEDGLTFIRHGPDLVREAAAQGSSALDARHFSSRKEATVAAEFAGAGGATQRTMQKNKKQKSQAEQRTSSSAGQKAGGGLPAKKKPPPPRRLWVPPTVSHFVMNLPASAITFLPRFRGVYAGCEDLFSRKETAETESVPSPPPLLPIVHVHCFAPKPEDENDPVPLEDVRQRVSDELGVSMALCKRYMDVEADDPLVAEPKHMVYVHNVRDVAPGKSMFCASFRLPASVAFAERD